MQTMSWLKLKFAAGVGVAALLAGGAATVAVSQGGGGDKLTPLEIVRQSQEAYAALTSYSDSGTVVLESGGSVSGNTTFQIRLQRPNFYRVEWALSSANAPVVKRLLWSAGDGDFTLMSGGGRGITSTGGREVNPTPEKHPNRKIAFAASARFTGSESLTIPGAFFDPKGGDSLRLAASSTAKLTKEPDAKIGGVDCHSFTCVVDPSKLPAAENPSNNMGKLGTSITTYWIGKKDPPHPSTPAFRRYFIRVHTDNRR